MTAQADAVADAGLTTSGLGRQRIAELQKIRNLTSAEALGEIDTKRQAQHLFKTRTFEDLERGEERKEKATEQDLERIKFNLDASLGALAFESITKRRQNEVDRKKEVAKKAKTFSREEFTRFIIGLGTNTGQIEAANRAFGGLF